MRTFRRAVAALLAVAATVTPAVAAEPAGPRYSGPLGAALHAAGLDRLPGLTLDQGPLGSVPLDLGSAYAVGGTAATLAVLRGPAEAADVRDLSVWVLLTPGQAPRGWLVEQHGDGGATASAVDAATVAPAARGITGCDVAGEILGQLFPGIGLLFAALCGAPGPEGGVRWENYNPILPQAPHEYYDKGWQWNPHVGDEPVWQYFDVRYQSQRCFTKEHLFALSQKPVGRYTGPSNACVSHRQSDLLAGRYVYLTASYYSDVVWIDGTRQLVTFTTGLTETWAPTVYHINRLVPSGHYVGTGTTKEYWPEFCGPTHNPTIDPRMTYACKTGQVRDHVEVLRYPV